MRLRAAANAPAAEQKALAQLTVDIHAPLANRLGIWQLKWELEDLAFRYLQPETYQRIARLLDEKRTGRERYIEEAKQKIRAALAEAGIDADVAGRPKHIYSIWRKMQRKGLDFSELYDIRAMRVLVDDVADCYAALGLVHQLWTPVPCEFDDYIAKPKGNDYRSCTPPWSARRAGRWKCRSAPTTCMSMPNWAWPRTGATRKAARRRGQLRAQDRLDAAVAGDARGRRRNRPCWPAFNTELLEDRIYLLTPKGEVMDLPQGGTVLDFAYHVHTEVGHRCRGAKVNGRIVPLDYKPRQRRPRRDHDQQDRRAAARLAAGGQRLPGQRRARATRCAPGSTSSTARATCRPARRCWTRNCAGWRCCRPISRRCSRSSTSPAMDELQLALALGDVGPQPGHPRVA